MASALEGRGLELLEAPNFCSVATILKDGTPHVVPTWVDVADGHVLLNSAEGRVWPSNIRRDPRVTLTVLNQDNPYEFVSIRGRLVEDIHEGADEHIDKMAKKYLGQDTYPYRQEGEQRVIFRIEPQRVIHHGQ